jgi:hypothetical protein
VILFVVIGNHSFGGAPATTTNVTSINQQTQDTGTIEILTYENLHHIAIEIPPHQVAFFAQFGSQYENASVPKRNPVDIVYDFLVNLRDKDAVTIEQLYQAMVECGLASTAKNNLQHIMNDLKQIDSIVQQVGGLHRSIIITTITTETVV